MLFVGLAVCLGAGFARPRSAQPNVLFVVVDDLNPSLSSYGYPTVTPSIDAFANTATQLQFAYASVAVCSPSRTAFLTGLRPDSSQVWTIGPYFRDAARGHGLSVETIPQAFRAAGYNTTSCGKIFHPGTPSGGLSSSEGGGDMCPEFPDGNCAWTSSAGRVGSWSIPHWFCDQFVNDTVQSPPMQGWPCANATWPSCGSGCVQSNACIECFKAAKTWGVDGLAMAAALCPDDCYPEGLIANEAIARLQHHAANPDTPFFLAVGFKRPHLSYKAPQKYFDLYNLSDIALPAHQTFPPTLPPIAYTHSCMASLRDVEPYGINATCSPTGGCFEYVSNTTTIQRLILGYYAAVSFTDTHFGRVMDALTSLGLDNNTIVTFVGDHGYQNGQRGIWCKQTNFELGVRVPLFVRVPPTVDPAFLPHTEMTIVETVDLFPTLVELAGLPPPPQALLGESLVPLLGLQHGGGERVKTWSLSQWPRRPSCLRAHSCLDGAGNPFDFSPDQAIMGYTLRTATWRYGVWVPFDWNATAPNWTAPVFARELYDHTGDNGLPVSGETLENVNLAADPAYASVVAQLHNETMTAVNAALLPPIMQL